MLSEQVVNEDGALAWSPIVMHPSFHPDLPAITYLRLKMSTGQVRLAHARNLPPRLLTRMHPR